MSAMRSDCGPAVLAHEFELTCRLSGASIPSSSEVPLASERGSPGRGPDETLLSGCQDMDPDIGASEAAERRARSARAAIRDRQAYGPELLRRRLRMRRWQFNLARERELIPEPDLDNGTWSALVEVQLEARAEEIVLALGAVPPVGATKAATVLRHTTGLLVIAEDVRRLAAAGELRPCGGYRGWPTYSRETLAAVPFAAVEQAVMERMRKAADTARAAVEVLERRLAASFSEEEAAEILGWSRRRLAAATTQGDLTIGPDGRYERAEVIALAAAGSGPHHLSAVVSLVDEGVVGGHLGAPGGAPQRGQDGLAGRHLRGADGSAVAAGGDGEQGGHLAGRLQDADGPGRVAGGEQFAVATPAVRIEGAQGLRPGPGHVEASEHGGSLPQPVCELTLGFVERRHVRRRCVIDLGTAPQHGGRAVAGRTVHFHLRHQPERCAHSQDGLTRTHGLLVEGPRAGQPERMPG